MFNRRSKSRPRSAWVRNLRDRFFGRGADVVRSRLRVRRGVEALEPRLPLDAAAGVTAWPEPGAVPVVDPAGTAHAESLDAADGQGQPASFDECTAENGDVATSIPLPEREGASVAESSASTMVRFRFEVTDLDGDAISRVLVGDSFQLRVFISDMRSDTPADDKGVFVAYQDVTFENQKAVATTITHNDATYGLVASGDIQPGMLEEVGSSHDSLIPLGDAEFLLYVVDLMAVQSGELTFVGNPPDALPEHHIGVFGSDVPVAFDSIDFGQVSIAVLDPKVSTVGLYDRVGHTFYLNNKTDGSTSDMTVFVTPTLPSTWQPVTGDWNGDGQDTVGLYDNVNHTFYLNNKTDGSTSDVIVFVTPSLPASWLPVVGDWNGDGIDTVGLYDNVGHTFYLNNRTDGSTSDMIVVVTPAVPASWLPLAGDWNGDGDDTIGLYDRINHTFYLNNRVDGSVDDMTVLVTPSVPASWRPLVGDWDGDGDDTIGLYDNRQDTFYLNNRIDGSTSDMIIFTTPQVPSTFLPLAGDWDGRKPKPAAADSGSGDRTVADVLVNGVKSEELRLDVDGNGFVTSLDVLVVINRLNAATSSRMAETGMKEDVNRDGIRSPLDALILINYLNANRSSPLEDEKEGSGDDLDEFLREVDELFAQFVEHEETTREWASQDSNL